MYHFVKQALSSGHVSQTEYKYSTNDFPLKPVIYGVPEVHKLTEGFLKCFPILASRIGTLAKPLSSFVDDYIRPLVEKLPSHIKDTGDFMTQLSNWNGSNCDI